MKSDEPSTTGPASSSLHEIVVTLPVAAIAGLSLLVLAGLAGAAAAMALGADKVREAGAQSLVVLLPMLFAVIAAIGIRRTSTRQIDELVARFLERTVFPRLEAACADHRDSGFPFRRAHLLRRAQGRSYVRIGLDWAEPGPPPAVIDVKMNVFNIELVAALPLSTAALAGQEPVEFIDRHNLDRVRSHPLLKHFAGTLQGAVEEGYAIRVSVLGRTEAVTEVQVSLRQKLQQHFLANPYLKRYFAEDLCIATGVVFGELRASGLQAAP
ncbi:MAG: hypothetical protein QM788_02095 [Roseateles sp.]|uniref:hypothetical protein n=1 Tax=Roseateles sp. TaxID=1971397 RepID=UPI0039EB0F0B